MNKIINLENKIKQLIDDLKGLCSNFGLSNQAGEELVVTTVFLYKFLNDKYIYNKMQKQYDVEFHDSDTISALIQYYSDDKFYKIYDETLERINEYEKNAIFSIETAGGNKKPLFSKISDVIVDVSKKNDFVKGIFNIISQDKFDFGEAFDSNFDFFTTIFEYLIKDYNTASGKYAEYFTPQEISSVVSRILMEITERAEDRKYDIYDPSAGSGSLLLHLANEIGKDNVNVYSQDISNKSTRFLRLNIILNGLVSSLNNIIEGNTLLDPAHFKIKGNENSGLKQFDFITANPPFKTDFSNTRDEIENKWKGTDRFFAGIPKIPSKKKDSMAIYLMFMQHILYSLKDDGKAAIIIPTGFITAQSGIEKKIREKMIEDGILRGVISLPSNIFVNTGTNTTVVFIDKTMNKDDDIILVDASSLGTKVKEGKGQKTVLSNNDIDKIIDAFVNKKEIEDFSVKVTKEEIINKNFSFSAGQYFDVKIEYIEMSQAEYDKMIDDFKKDFSIYVNETLEFQRTISKQLTGLNIK